MSGASPAPRRPVLPRLRRIARTGARGVAAHGLRSMLTALGIVIGVAAVIAMSAVSEGASREAQRQFRDLGAANILLRSVKPPAAADGARRGFGPPRSVVYGLTAADLAVLRDTIPGVAGVTASRIVRKSVWNGSLKLDADVVGTAVDYPASRGRGVREGRFFSEEEARARANVAVLDAAAAAALFPFDDPLGRSVRIDGGYYGVVGVMEPEGSSGPAAGAPARLYIPFDSSRSRFGETVVRRTAGGMESETVELHEAVIRMEDQNAVIEAGRIVESVLARRRRDADYAVEVPLALLRQAEERAMRDRLVAGAIAGISLLVGGIGIMNIMLASVTERTREIGIRRALGARRRDIAVQFLAEAVILAGAGGLAGVALGIAIPFVLSAFWGMAVAVTAGAPLLAFSVSAAIGVVFGIYPGMRAADMDPVEALRHE